MNKETATGILDSIAMPETVKILIFGNEQDEFAKAFDPRSERISGWRNFQGDLKNAGLITDNLDERNESRARPFMPGSEVWIITHYTANLTPLGNSLILEKQIEQSGNIWGKAIVGYWKMTGIDGIFQEKPEIAEIDAKYVFEKTPFYDICVQHSGTPKVKQYWYFERFKFVHESLRHLPKPNDTKVVKYSAKKYEDGQWKIDLPPSAIKLAPYANNLGEIEDRDPKPNGSVVSGLVNATSKESVNPISNMDCSASGLMGSITGNSVRVRSSPDALSTTNILFRVNKGDSFFWLESKKNELGESWEKVCFDGKIGWVSSDYIILIGD